MSQCYCSYAKKKKENIAIDTIANGKSFFFLNKRKGTMVCLAHIMEYGNAYRILRSIKINIMINCNSHKDKSVLNDRRIFISIKFWLFLSEIKITFKLLMKLFIHKSYYIQPDDSLFWQWIRQFRIYFLFQKHFLLKEWNHLVGFRDVSIHELFYE